MRVQILKRIKILNHTQTIHFRKHNLPNSIWAFWPIQHTKIWSTSPTKNYIR